MGVLVVLALAGALALTQVLDGFLAVVPLMALAILGMFWAFRRSAP